MVLRQFQEQNRRIWNIPDDRNSRQQVPKNQQTAQLFGAYLPIHKWHFCKVMKKNDFYNFNLAHNQRDGKGNVRVGITGLYYIKVCFPYTVYDKLNNTESMDRLVHGPRFLIFLWSVSGRSWFVNP